METLRSRVVAPQAPAGTAGWVPPPRAWGLRTPSPLADTRRADLAALAQVRWAALVALIGSLLGVVVLVLTTTGYYEFGIPAAGSALRVNQAALVALLAVGEGGLGITAVSFGFYRGGFLALRPTDPRFRTSPTWTLLAIVGILLVALGLAVVVGGLLELLACTGGSTASVPAACVDLGTLLGGAVVVFVGGVVALVGLVGTIVAVWRLGDRFDDSFFKIGAILLIIPYASIVGQILVLVATSRAKTKVEQHPPFAMAPSFPTWPPPGR